MTRSYGGLAGITLRLLTHATDGYGISIPYFERLKPMKEISEDEFQTYADHPETADDLYSFAEIDVDKNVLRIDEDWKEERSYREYPLQLLLAQAAPLISSNPYSGWFSAFPQRGRNALAYTGGGIGEHPRQYVVQPLQGRGRGRHLICTPFFSYGFQEGGAVPAGTVRCSCGRACAM